MSSHAERTRRGRAAQVVAPTAIRPCGKSPTGGYLTERPGAVEQHAELCRYRTHEGCPRIRASRPWGGTTDGAWREKPTRRNNVKNDNWSGSFAIPMTPFDDSDRIDENALEAEIEFCIASKVGGIVVPVMVSEFRALSEDERREMVRITLQVANGRVPVVANCAAVNTPLAVRYAENFQKLGADAMIAMPPYTLVPDYPTIREYFRAISDAVAVPIWIQNVAFARLSVDQVVSLCEEIENVSWVKEEVPPTPRSIGAITERNSAAVKGVMGGVGGRLLMAERARGSKGVVHACQFCDLIQRVWELLDAGSDDEAQDLFDIVLPGLVAEQALGMGFAKEIMVRRGVLKNNRVRSQAVSLDPLDLAEVDRVWRRIEPHLIWHP
ncbi:MAG: dihydrodipicolinate synthase family protein [Spirochaetaceae bacterium]|nr:MAG: dihydrodipicolinate synthase family protein [Spirochaetaceae bacterium]